jgi:Fe-S cluster assembly ATP-binding protein
MLAQWASTSTGSFPDETRRAKRKAGLIITHSGNILNYTNIDKAHVMHGGRIGCSGNPAIILEQVGKYGYEQCIHCMGMGCS